MILKKLCKKLSKKMRKFANPTLATRVSKTRARYQGRLKSHDPILSRRWAQGYYCRVEGRHFIILDDAEILDCCVRGNGIVGIVEVIPETVEETK